jgi:hypothetical protein
MLLSTASAVTMRAYATGPGALRAFLVVMTIAMVVIGGGTLFLALAPAGSSVRAARAGILMTPMTGPAPVHARSSSERTDPDLESPLNPKAGQPHAMSGDAFAAARTYLFEMSARLHRSTLGADQATRATISPDIYAYQWLGLIGSVQEPMATPPSKDDGTCA